jgi:hypothetical protein
VGAAPSAPPTGPGGPLAIVVERNRLVGRRIGRVLGAAGFVPRVAEEPAAVEVAGAQLLVADAFDAAVVMRHLATQPSLRAVLYTAEPCDRLLPLALEAPRLSTILGRAGFDQPPREAELLATARTALTGEPVPLSALVAWGAASFQRNVVDNAGLDGAVAEVQAFTLRLGAAKRVGEMLGELTHELLMNAVYDAPVDGAGQPLHAHDRKSPVTLAANDAATLRCASDGMRVAVEVVDRFGRLERRHLFGGIVRGLAGGEQDRAGGGAGLGLLMAYRSTTALYVDVAPGRRTRVTGLFDLDLNLREFRQLAKTVHFPDART